MMFSSMPTPWGTSQTRTEMAKGIVFYTTSSHGGMHLTKARMDKMPEQFKSERGYGTHAERNGEGWFEEDCEVGLVIEAFPDDFTPEQVETAKKSNRNWYPKLAV